jgi:hypothetical protein
LAALACGIVSLVLQAALALTTTTPQVASDGACALLFVGGFIAPQALLAFELWRSKAPVRRGHGLAAGAGAVFATCGALWAHCPGTTLAHIGVNHIAVPIATVVAATWLIARITRAKPLQP